jgi:hypothetical protein
MKQVSTHVDANISAGPELLVIPKSVQLLRGNLRYNELLNPDFLIMSLTETMWYEWYLAQKAVGNLDALYRIMPSIYVPTFSDPKTSSLFMPNLLMGEDTVSDTTPLELTITMVRSTKADSLYIALFNKSIVSIPPNELITALNRGLLVHVGVDSYARINSGHIFKSAMALA